MCRTQFPKALLIAASDEDISLMDRAHLFRIFPWQQSFILFFFGSGEEQRRAERNACAQNTDNISGLISST